MVIRMKKIISLILCLCIPLVIVGCGKQQNSTDKTDDIIIYPDEEAERTLGGYRDDYNSSSTTKTGDVYYIVNTSSKKFHISSCGNAKTIQQEHRKTAIDRQKLIDEGYSPCGSCKP